MTLVILKDIVDLTGINLVSFNVSMIWLLIFLTQESVLDNPLMIIQVGLEGRVSWVGNVIVIYSFPI